MSFQGGIRKLKSVLKDPVHYFLPIGEREVFLNDYLGKTFSARLTGEIRCLNCDRLTKKSYSQGYCFPCSQNLARCDLCIVRPEKCHYHLGTCREPEWGKAHCFIPHLVYLANTSGLKVGIMRETQAPTRWIDQGAVQALPIFRVMNRYQSGLIEVELKKQVNDRTDWRKMLIGKGEPRILAQDRAALLENTDLNLANTEVLLDAEMVQIQYPVLEYPIKVKSLALENHEMSGTLLGIKGQYLIFDTGVINIRNLSGYHLALG